MNLMVKSITLANIVNNFRLKMRAFSWMHRFEIPLFSAQKAQFLS